jgi:sugar lactone lactonase YvrE
MMRRAAILAIAAAALLAPIATAGHDRGQGSIALPDEFRPEGIATGKHSTFYVGSIPLGAVYRGSYRTGEGAVLVPPHPGRNHVGLKADTRNRLLFVAGGGSKGIYVYDAKTGADVAAYSLPDAGFVNDVALTRRAAYFTDSQVQQLYRVPIGRHGELGEVERIPLTGDLQYVAGFNLNGIDATRDGRTLIAVQSVNGKLFRIDARSGETREIALHQPVTNGDGILLRCGKLFVVRNRENRIAVVDLDRRLRSGTVVRHLTDPRLDVPTTIAPFGKSVYAVNARFDRPDDSEDDVLRIAKR